MWVKLNLKTFFKTYTNQNKNTLCQRSYRNNKLLLYDYERFVVTTFNTTPFGFEFYLISFYVNETLDSFDVAGYFFVFEVIAI